MIKKTMRSILFIISITFSFGAMELSAQDSNLTPKKTKSKYKKARVLQPSTAKTVVKIVEALERQKTIKVPDPENEGKFIAKEEDDPDYVKARELLTELLNNRSEMKSYDR